MIRNFSHYWEVFERISDYQDFFEFLKVPFIIKFVTEYQRQFRLVNIITAG